MKVTLINEELSPHALKELEVRCWDDENEEAFRDAFDQFHYLKCPNGRQMLLKQVVLHQDRPVALLSWTHCCRALSERDNWVGWDRRTCSRRLPLVVQNNRFLLLTSAAGRTRNLASRVLALSVDHMAACWEEKFGHCVWLAETFVDPDRFNGGCYLAAGWHKAGQSAGFSRFGPDYYQSNDHPKDLWIKPLRRDARERLRDPSVPLPGEKQRAAGVMPVKAKVAESLAEALRKVPDPRSRRGRQFPLGAMLATAVLALASGGQTVSDIFRFCQDLTWSQRRNLGFRPNSKARKVVPPPGENCWRKVLSRIDSKQLAAVINKWLQDNRQELPPMLSIDGKVIGNNLATIVSVVDARDGSPVAQLAANGNGKEQELANDIIDSFPEGSLDGKTIGGDALYAQRDLVRTLVQDHGANVLVQLKANQPGTLKNARRLLDQQAPPF